MIDLDNLDFDNVKAALIEHFSSDDSPYKDFNYEGSNLSVLLDILAYTTEQNAYYLKQSINESYFSTSKLRNSTVKHAKSLGYTPRSTKASNIEIELTFTDNIDFAYISANTPLTSVKGKNESYTFINLVPLAIEDNKCIGTFYEGKLNTKIVSYDPGKLIRLESPRIDRDTVVVTIGDDIWEHVNRLSTGKVYYVQEGLNNSTEIYFGFIDNHGYAGHGDQPTQGENITITYLETGGDKANGCKTFASNSINNVPSTSITISPNNISQGGDEPETIDQIKFIAPKINASQNRAITKQDYLALISDKFGDIEDLNIWGGEDNTPPRFGTVFVCIKPKSSSYVTHSTKQQMIKYLNELSTVGIDTTIVDPDYLFCTFKIQVKIPYWASHKTNSKGIITDHVNTTVDAYMTNIPGFNQGIRISNLSTEIDKSKYIESNITRIVVSKYMNILSNGASVLDFANSIVPGSIISELIDGKFKIIDDGEGNLFKYIPHTESYDINTLGTVNYNTGTISIASYDSTKEVEFFVEPTEIDIITNKNIILNKKRIVLEFIDG